MLPNLEMRWLEYDFTELRPELGEGIGMGCLKQRLQYRTREYWDVNKVIYGDWTEWQDVPTVREEDDRT